MKTDFKKLYPGIHHVHWDTAKDKEFVDTLIGQLQIAQGDEEFNDELQTITYCRLEIIINLKYI